MREGKMLGLATTGPERDPALPELPTVAEAALPGFDVRLWLGVPAPAGTPRAVIDRLSVATAKALATADLVKTLGTQGFAPRIGTPDQFDQFYRSEVTKWAKVVEATGMVGE